MKFGRWDQRQVACFTPPPSPMTNHFLTAFTFLKRDQFGEHNPSTTALVSFGYYLTLHHWLLQSNSLQNNKILVLRKLKAYSDNNINARQVMISVVVSVGNRLGKRENACYQNFLLFPKCFEKSFSSGC